MITACYDQWKSSYVIDKMMKKNFLVLDLGYTQTSMYLLNTNRVCDIHIHIIHKITISIIGR